MCYTARMDALLKVDRQIILWLGRHLRRWQDQTRVPVHATCFWAVSSVHVASWLLLALLEEQPVYLWYIVSAAIGVLAAYLVDNEPVAPLSDGLALTQFGVEPRWSLMRLLYLVVAAVVVIPLILTSGLSLAMATFCLLEVVLFVLQEYLLAFRLLESDHPLFASRDELQRQLRVLFGAAAPDGPAPEGPAASD